MTRRLNSPDVRVSECGCTRNRDGLTVHRCPEHKRLDPFTYAQERVNSALEELQGALADVRFGLLAQRIEPHPAETVASDLTTLVASMCGRLGLIESQARTGTYSPQEIADKIRRALDWIIEQQTAGGGTPVEATRLRCSTCPRCSGSLVLDDRTNTVYCETDPDHYRVTVPAPPKGGRS